MNSERASNSIKKVVIAGAGPAGASLAIRLTRTGFDVTLVERERFPRQKLCGEFISPECLEHFRDLGVSDEMLASGGDRIAKTIFYSPDGNSVDVPSEWFLKGSRGALSLSRAKMDLILLEEARNLGVEVLEETAVSEIVLDGKLIRGITVKNLNNPPWNIEADAFVDATGRSRVVSKLAERHLGKQKKAGRQKWIGFKAHFKNVDMPRGRCEIYFFDGGYGGLSHIEKDRANNCFLIRADVAREFGGNAETVFRQLVLKNRRAAKTLGGAKLASDWIAVSIGEFGRKESSTLKNLFSIGDSAAFIDPFTGSGMLMALESSRVFAECLSFPHRSLKSIGATYRLEYGRRFSNRLWVCKAMRKISFSPKFASIAIRCLGAGKFLRYGIAKATRSAS